MIDSKAVERIILAIKQEMETTINTDKEFIESYYDLDFIPTMKEILSKENIPYELIFFASSSFKYIMEKFHDKFSEEQAVNLIIWCINILKVYSKNDLSYKFHFAFLCDAVSYIFLGICNNCWECFEDVFLDFLNNMNYNDGKLFEIGINILYGCLELIHSKVFTEHYINIFQYLINGLKMYCDDNEKLIFVSIEILKYLKDYISSDDSELLLKICLKINQDYYYKLAFNYLELSLKKYFSNSICLLFNHSIEDLNNHQIVFYCDLIYKYYSKIPSYYYKDINIFISSVLESNLFYIIPDSIINVIQVLPYNIDLSFLYNNCLYQFDDCNIVRNVLKFNSFYVSKYIIFLTKLFKTKYLSILISETTKKMLLLKNQFYGTLQDKENNLDVLEVQLSISFLTLVQILAVQIAFEPKEKALGLIDMLFELSNESIETIKYKNDLTLNTLDHSFLIYYYFFLSLKEDVVSPKIDKTKFTNFITIILTKINQFLITNTENQPIIHKSVEILCLIFEKYYNYIEIDDIIDFNTYKFTDNIIYFDESLTLAKSIGFMLFNCKKIIPQSFFQQIEQQLYSLTENYNQEIHSKLLVQLSGLFYSCKNIKNFNLVFENLFPDKILLLISQSNDFIFLPLFHFYKSILIHEFLRIDSNSDFGIKIIYSILEYLHKYFSNAKIEIPLDDINYLYLRNSFELLSFLLNVKFFDFHIFEIYNATLYFSTLHSFINLVGKFQINLLFQYTNLELFFFKIISRLISYHISLLFSDFVDFFEQIPSLLMLCSDELNRLQITYNLIIFIYENFEKEDIKLYYNNHIEEFQSLIWEIFVMLCQRKFSNLSLIIKIFQIFFLMNNFFIDKLISLTGIFPKNKQLYYNKYCSKLNSSIENKDFDEINNNFLIIYRMFLEKQMQNKLLGVDIK